MVKADFNHITRVDPSRRRFMAVAAAASAVSAGALAAAAMPPGALKACSLDDAEIIAAGAKFEFLLTEYLPGRLEWARRHRAGKAEIFAKFGNDYGSPALERAFFWHQSGPGVSQSRSRSERHVPDFGRAGSLVLTRWSLLLT